MSILHTVNRSPFQDRTLASCLGAVAPGCGVLLIEDGVYAARAGGHDAHLILDVAQRARVFALDADLQARGISRTELLEDVRVVDYGGFVQLVCEFDKMLAWF